MKVEVSKYFLKWYNDNTNKPELLEAVDDFLFEAYKVDDVQKLASKQKMEGRGVYSFRGDTGNHGAFRLYCGAGYFRANPPVFKLAVVGLKQKSSDQQEDIEKARDIIADDKEQWTDWQPTRPNHLAELSRMQAEQETQALAKQTAEQEKQAQQDAQQKARDEKEAKKAQEQAERIRKREEKRAAKALQKAKQQPQKKKRNKDKTPCEENPVQIPDASVTELVAVPANNCASIAADTDSKNTTEQRNEPVAPAVSEPINLPSPDIIQESSDYIVSASDYTMVLIPQQQNYQVYNILVDADAVKLNINMNNTWSINAPEKSVPVTDADSDEYKLAMIEHWLNIENSKIAIERAKIACEELKLQKLKLLLSQKQKNMTK